VRQRYGAIRQTPVSGNGTTGINWRWYRHAAAGNMMVSFIAGASIGARLVAASSLYPVAADHIV
jgi:hypothetical protein